MPLSQLVADTDCVVKPEGKEKPLVPPAVEITWVRFTGIPASVTPPTTDSTTKIATTAFTKNAIAIQSAADRQAVDQTLVNYALLANPSFTGTPTAPTAAISDYTTKLATTAFVKNLVSNDIALSNQAIAQNLTNYALINSPTFTGIPAAPTVATADSSTKLATTEFTKNAIAVEINALAQSVSGKSITIGSTGIILDGSTSTLAGLTSVTATNFYGRASSASYADLAEKYTSDAEYEVGTVLEFNGSQEVTKSMTPGTHRIAGVVSLNPAYLMNSECDSEFTAAIALQGRCPVKVIGPIKKGDLLISAGDGRAKSNNSPQVGTVLGKSLEDFTGSLGTIEVAVGRC